ncbi:DUF2142 domain-containing protein [Nakamurella endophytica]|uniref:Uncharacterized protein n=1 Tax=Nakamurella endophytica TaxID=1748367 RepID=A0A917SXB2_9ACTN|nr:DUF2142 domain-containing protein [Nakamurella endophytica]GGM01388.1 hypothetical protein GCM10011594_21830 [Nakamurella endophytica]
MQHSPGDGGPASRDESSTAGQPDPGGPLPTDPQGARSGPDTDSLPRVADATAPAGGTDLTATGSAATDLITTGSAEPATVPTPTVPAPTIPAPAPAGTAVSSPDGRPVPSGSHPASTPPALRRRARLAVTAATLLFAALCLGYLVNTPPLVSPDELYHFDRVIAAEHGQIVLDPTEINVSKGARGVEGRLVVSLMRRSGPSWAQFTPLMRDQRPSLDALGGNSRSPKRDVSNYMTQHPPLYYALMGAVAWALPGADRMAADKLIFLLRLFNVLLLLPLPLLFHRAARNLLGEGPVAMTAAFLPLLVAGLARSAATINNDNLAFLLGAAVFALSMRVLRGDTGVRTAAWIAVLCVAASLTKSTVLMVLVVVPIAYGIRALRARRLPRWPTLAVLVAGAAGAAVWWVRNLVLFHAVQPNAWGSQFARAQGSPRTPDNPPDWDRFWSTVRFALPSRLWGALGILEPPRLPTPMVVTLTTVTVLAALFAVATQRGLRWEFAALFAVPLASLVMVVWQSYRHYLAYVAIAAIQGRYAYPALIGLLLPIAVLVVALLGRFRRWAPALVAAAGLLVTGWGLYASVEYTWLVRGRALVPSDWGTALRNLAGFFPWAPWVLGGIGVVTAALAVAGVVATVLSCRRLPPGPPPAAPADGFRPVPAAVGA